jgi:excisionase family DNA binding protein
MIIKQVFEYLRVNQRTAYRLAVVRRLPGFKVGANWRFKRGDVDGWIAAQSRTIPDEEAHTQREGKYT